MRMIQLIPLAAAAALLATPALAQKIKPGLWESGLTMKSAGGEMEGAMARMQAELASMPPERRRQMEAMMSGRMGMATGAPTMTRICITPEQAARDEMPGGDGQCRQTDFRRSGNIVKFKFVCDGKDAKGSGEGEYTLVSDSEHRGKMTIVTERGGKPERMEMQTTGRWLGADCGAVKPHTR